MTITTFTNAKIITGDEVINGTIQFDDHGISDIQSGNSQIPAAIDCQGDYIAPGLVELHTDNLERHLQPRPSVHYPHNAAVMAHDRELASTGITTVFDALRIGSMTPKESQYQRYARECAHEILHNQAQGNLKISHYLHIRSEVCSETLLDEIAEFSTEDRIGIVSLMDHTPGQRQFRDITQMEAYLQGKYGMNREQMDAHFDSLYELQNRLGKTHEQATIEFARAMNATLASHDDTTTEDVLSSKKNRVSLAEFPTTVEAAAACREHNIPVMMGAPNLVRGSSHSGNVSAMELVRMNLMDIISSDYIPSALLYSAVKVGMELNDLPQGIATATRAPALAAGLTDRGELKPGLRADLIRFSLAADTPLLQSVWCKGQRVS
ncbi:alpha-D-ribose 1-methylphosphonate 5-triphosphate diphosphatase [Reinekea thalattae]|uniref:Alpha-D-ribose 1-methylphosphonate 5-triphosphate diphosphatase n=1 Tax=Reinekea thalattae TaxID=2593301 RepID=A0A5C8ZC94_9GAMM|nr:alpha-D-ribose 1-methylphosphonate 5-triphosphate diphosphatase [Reinekea thalattae]TXR54536.1 alpha-D-ribose 1-methylphosphonate 5-triphosphate diphosphatase [Reinekea thalattae]